MRAGFFPGFGIFSKFNMKSCKGHKTSILNPEKKENARHLQNVPGICRTQSIQIV